MSERLQIIEEQRKKFQGVTETYKMTTFLLTLSLMYPNPRRDGKRKVMIVFFILYLIPMDVFGVYDMWLRILRKDIANLIRQSIVMVSVNFLILKLILTMYRNREMRSIIDAINKDYETYNGLPEEYRLVVTEAIRKTKMVEKAWLLTMTSVAMSYPLLAAVCTTYSFLFSENPKRFMIHEMILPFLTEEQKYESPYYEMFAVYSFILVWLIFIGYTGYEGIFAICIQHASLKIKIFSLNLKYLFVDPNDLQKMKKNICEFVKDHSEVCRFIDEIQKCFEVWLAGIFFVSVLQFGMSLIQITTDNTGGDLNGMYYLFAGTTVVFIYLPCHLASDVTYNAAQVATMAYDSSWELVQDIGIRRSICFIIAKAQIPIHLQALGMLTFNMEMFVSILQTGYSMYTLMRT